MQYPISCESRIYTTALGTIHSITTKNTMGGDDLDDDDNQWIQPVRAGGGGGGGGGSTKDAYSPEREGDDDGDNSSSEPLMSSWSSAVQRPRPESTDETTRETKKSRIEATRSSSSLSQAAQARLLVQAGIHLQDQDSNQCAQFLSTMVQHYTLVVEHNHDVTNDTAAAAKSTVPDTKLLAQYCLGRSSSSSSSHAASNGTLERIKELVSVKQMKQWKVVGSPCIVRFCAVRRSRRAVHTLGHVHQSPLPCARAYQPPNPFFVFFAHCRIR
jgi:hypothetical protein